MPLLNKLVLIICLLQASFGFTQESEADTRGLDSPEAHLVSILDDVKTLHAEFAHQTSSGELQTGEFWLRKPGHFRVETSAPLSQTIVSDGVSMWTHDRDLEQVIISPLNSRLDEMPILLFAGDPEFIPESYTIEFFEGEDRQHFLLTPLDSTSLVTTLVLSFEDRLPVSVSVENAMQERTVIRLTRTGELTEPAGQLFTFQVPEFADVIDDRPG